MELFWLFTEDKNGKWTSHGQFTDSKCNQILESLKANILRSVASPAKTEKDALEDLKDAIKNNQFRRWNE